MKPLHLRLQAFGSFAGVEEIDFEALAPRGLFVVSGDTGTGKTTVFDAMCWALYGTMPLKESKGVRSDHVPSETRTEVTLTFECGGERYVVTRNPEQRRPAKRGSGFADEPAGAHLARLTATGTEHLASSATDTSAACAELIGLDATQFQRVILLPQGEFSKFLLAGTSERELLLSQLFGAGVFDDIVEQLKSEADACRRELGDTDTRIDERLGHARNEILKVARALGVEPADGLADADRAALDGHLESLDPPLQLLRRHTEQLRIRSSAATGALAEAEELHRRFDQAARHRQRLADLDAQLAAITERLSAADAAAAARPVVDAADAHRSAVQLAADAAARRTDALDALARALAELGVDLDVGTATVTSIQATIEEQRRSHASQREVLRVLGAARQQLAEAQRAQQSLLEQRTTTSALRSTAEQRRQQIETELPGLAERAGAADHLRAALQELEAQIRLRQELDELLDTQATALSTLGGATAEHQRLLGEFVATQAPRLAQTLENGEPCPVCGAVEHPSPATTGGGATVGFDDVERASAARDAATQRVQEHQTALAALRSRLGDVADATPEELQRRRSSSAAQLADANAAADRLAQLERDLEEVTSDLQQHSDTLAKLSERTARAATELDDATAAATSAEQDAAEIDPGRVERTAALLEQLGVAGTGLEELFNAHTAAASTATTWEQQLATKLASSAFDSVDDARAAHLSTDDEAAHREAARQHTSARTESTGALQALAEQGIPDEPPDITAAAAAAAAATEEHRAASHQLMAADSARTAVIEALGHHDQLVADSGDLRDRAQLVQRVFQVCHNGGAGARMSLKRWVLTRELDRVTAAANVHLHRMTAQRYTLRRAQEQGDGRRSFGLDLDVIDAQTGRPRSTRSLSGGEQFQASLSLALGLADVVSHGGNSSGKRFEALFVDEGFGSLSAQALDDAIETLHQLHAAGRMVGAITHVEAMKQQLHVGIEVRRRDDGQGSTLVVHP